MIEFIEFIKDITLNEWIVIIILAIMIGRLDCLLFNRKLKKYKK